MRTKTQAMGHLGVAISVASDAPVWTSKVGAVGEALTALIAFLALIGAVYQLRQTHKTTLETRAHQYLQRYDEPQLLPYIAKAHAVFKDGEKGEPSTLIARWEAMSFSEQLDALLFLNFWEELAGMYNRKLVDRTIIDEWFGDAALDYWRMVEWLALYQREQLPENDIYNEWEMMCADIRRRRARGG